MVVLPSLNVSKSPTPTHVSRTDVVQIVSSTHASSPANIIDDIIMAWPYWTIVDVKYCISREALQLRGAGTRKLHGGRGPTSCELDRQVLEYAEKVKGTCGESSSLGVCRSGGRNEAALRDRQLQQVAREYAERLGVNGFKASGSWLRGWKGRCRQGKPQGREKRKEKSKASTPRTASSNLSTLTEHDRRGVAGCPGDQGVSEPLRDGEVSTGKQQPASVMSMTGSYQQVLHNGLPEHSYSNSPHNTHVTTPTPECATPPCLQVQMEELLGGVTLLRPGDQEEKLDLMALEEEVGGAVGGIPHHLHHQGVLNLPELIPGDAHHPSCHAPPSLLEGEDPVMALFNHRSFTDHFPFLPPSLFSSNNWCPPCEFPRHSASTMDSFMQATPLTHCDSKLTEGGLLQPKTKSKGRLTVDVGVSRYHTRSKAQAQAQAVATASPLSHSSGWAHTPTPSPSPSPLDTLYSPTRQAGSGAGGVALLSPPTPSTEGGVGTSPPAGGLLANRRFQPVFPDEPEIVFHEIQLGPLHTTPGHGP